MRSRVELFEQIRRDQRLDEVSIRELADRHRVHRRTARQALAAAVPPPRKVCPVRRRPALDAWATVIDAWLIGDKNIPRKQRHTARRIWQRLVAEHQATLSMVHDTFDHTSQLKLISTRFGVPVPNLTAWRNSTVGDMTSTFNFAVPPNPSPPNLGHPVLGALPKLPQCIPNVVLGTIGLNPNPVTGEIAEAIPYRVPYPQTMPTQETAPARGIPSGLC